MRDKGLAARGLARQTKDDDRGGAVANLLILNAGDLNQALGRRVLHHNLRGVAKGENKEGR